MHQENKVQLMTPEMPRSFYISQEEYATIYPEDITPQRLSVVFHHHTHTTWVDESVADFIIRKFPDIYKYETPIYGSGEEPEKEPEMVVIVTGTPPKRIIISAEEYKTIYPDRTPVSLPLTFGYGNRSVRVEPEVAKYVTDKYPDIYYETPPKPAEKVEVEEIKVEQPTEVKKDDKKPDSSRDNKTSGRPKRTSIRKR